MATAAAGRPKGYTSTDTWKPVTWALVRQIQSVLREYREYLPLTARQIFYRMVGQYDYDKTEQAYARLCEALVKARRAQVIPFHSIRDDGTGEHGGEGGYGSTGEWWRSIKSYASAYRRDRMEGQDVRIEVWLEAAGMGPQIARVTVPYSIPVFTTGGFSSVTVTKEIADRVSEAEKPTVFMHLGDFDPSGESIFKSMADDVMAFVAGDLRDWSDAAETFRPIRVALTEEQVRLHDLPTAPAKKSDSRTRNWIGETCQLEAMDPATIAETLERAIDAELDADVRAEVLEREEIERNDLNREVQKHIEDRA